MKGVEVIPLSLVCPSFVYPAGYLENVRYPGTVLLWMILQKKTPYDH